MGCVRCAEEVPSRARFCPHCGTPQQPACPSCGAAASPGARFCSHCGTPLGEPIDTQTAAGQPPRPTATPAADRVAAQAERRVCSVLFADLVGFTPLAEARDPEEVRELLSRYFDVARTVVGRYGGTVEKFIGDAVMAIWGAPVARDGDTERAVRAALDLVDAVADLGREVGADRLAARAGVVTGEVAVTLGAIGQGMVAGDAVNTAARVQAAADAGTVLVDEGTWRTARGAVAFTAAGDRALKGKTSPVPLWRADRVLAGVGGSQRIDGLEAPLVGRDAELRLLKEAFHACVDRRSPRLVSITGQAGVGKTRLGWEFEKYIDGLAAPVYWHRGRCLSYGDGVAFWALAEIVRARFDIAEEDPTPLATEKFTEGLIRWLPDPTARDYIRPRLARLLGVDAGDDTPLSREELFAGWRLLVEQLAGQAPVVLLIDDLHHADSGLLDFLEHLLDWTREVPVFVVTLARPELAEIRPGWGAGRPGSTTLALEPLDAAAMAVMLDRLVPDMPADARQALAAQAQGIPLYAVETVRMLIDRDVIRPVDGAYRLVGDIGHLTVPESLVSLLAARLDALGPDIRRLAADAAVLGGSFPAEALVAVAGLPPEQVHAGLADLLHREVLTVRADKLSPQRGHYAFVQTLVRQVAYETLSRRDRKARHLAVAEHLTRAFADGGEEVSEVIAAHLLDALAAVPDDPDVPQLRERAVEALVRAAERAERTGAPGTAGRAYATAAGLREQEADASGSLAAAALWERAGTAAGVAADFPAAEQHGHHAGELYRRHGQVRDAARTAVAEAESLRQQGHYDPARQLLGEALTVLQPDPDADTVSCLRALATQLVFAGDAEPAHQLMDEAFRLAQDLDLADAGLTHLFTSSGLVFAHLNRPVQAEVAFREAARRAESSEDGIAVARALLNLSDVLLARDPSAAAEPAARAVEQARRVGARQVLAVASGNLVQAQVLTGDWTQALETLQGAEVGGLVGGLTAAPFVALFRLVLCALRGETEALDQPLAVVTGHWTASDEVQLRMAAALAQAVAAAARRQPARVLAYAAEIFTDQTVSWHEGPRWVWSFAADAALALEDHARVVGLLDWLDGRPPGHVPSVLRADRLRVRARLLAADGDPAAAGAFDTAVQALRRFGSPYHLAVGLLDQAEFHAPSRPERAVAPATEAAQIASRLGARPLQERADRLLLPDRSTSKPTGATPTRSA